jgi:hypothetical protein
MRGWAALLSVSIRELVCRPSHFGAKRMECGPACRRFPARENPCDLTLRLSNKQTPWKDENDLPYNGR